MPIRIPDALPATAALEEENIFVMTEHRAMHQDIRPLRVLLLNLMPTKITTETQILRKLSNTPIQDVYKRQPCRPSTAGICACPTTRWTRLSSSSTITSSAMLTWPIASNR